MATQLERLAPVAFMLAGALTVMTIGYGGFGEPAGLYVPVWPLVVMGFGVTILAGALGLLGLYPALRPQAPRLARLGAVAAAVAGLGASSWIVSGTLGMGPWDLPEPVASVVLLGGLFGFLASLSLIGMAILRTSAHPRVIGGMLTLGGLALLAPLANELLGWQPPEWLPVLLFGTYAAILLAAGIILHGSQAARAGRSRSGSASLEGAR